MDFNKLLFNDTEINLASDFPILPDPELLYQVNADLTIPAGKAGAGTEFKEGNIIAWDKHAVGTSGAGEYVVFGSGDGTGFIAGILHPSASGNITEPSMVYRVDKNIPITLTPVPAMEVAPTFFYVDTIGQGDVLIPLAAGGNIVVTAGTRVGIIYDDSISDWTIFIADAGVTSSISHFIGFFYEQDATDPLQVNYFMDLFPITPGTSLDLTKYNLNWVEDGQPAWKIISGAIEASSVSIADIVLEY